MHGRIRGTSINLLTAAILHQKIQYIPNAPSKAKLQDCYSKHQEKKSNGKKGPDFSSPSPASQSSLFYYVTLLFICLFLSSGSLGGNNCFFLLLLAGNWELWLCIVCVFRHNIRKHLDHLTLERSHWNTYRRSCILTFRGFLVHLHHHHQPLLLSSRFNKDPNQATLQLPNAYTCTAFPSAQTRRMPFLLSKLLLL